VKITPAAVVPDCPEGILWIRNLLKTLAAQGRTVFVSSHLMSEMALTADHLIIVGRGRLIADTPIADLTSASAQALRVRSPHAELLRAILTSPDVGISRTDPDVLEISGLDSDTVGRIAADHSIVLYESYTLVVCWGQKPHSGRHKPANDWGVRERGCPRALQAVAVATIHASTSASSCQAS
jgi:hypothetical protein